MRLPSRFRPPDLLRTMDQVAPWCVAVPGLGLSVRGWERTLERLPSSVAPAAVALPAFGVPAARGAALDPTSSARRLVARIDELGVRRTILFGHSASCQVVAEAARVAPERVAGLVLVGPTTDPAAATWASLVRRWLPTARREPLCQVPQLLRDYTYSGLVSFARAMDASRRHRLDEVLPDVHRPTLLVRGAYDRLCPSSWLDRLAERSCRPVVRTIPGAAHMVPLTRPSELAAEIRRFVQDVPR